MAELIPLAAKSLAAAEQAIDGLWAPASPATRIGEDSFN
jgi:hypothetical protein